MIRETQEQDREGVVELIREFYLEELSDYGYTFSYEKACEDFGKAIQIPCVYSLVIDSGSIDGFIGAIISERMFLSGNTAQELMWYVTKEKRTKGMRLLQEFEKGCLERGCDDIMMIGLEGSKVNKVYELMGYKRQESMYFKKLGG